VAVAGRTNFALAVAALAAQQAPQRALAEQARVEQEALIGTDYGTDSSSFTLLAVYGSSAPDRRATSYFQRARGDFDMHT